ncbi:biotin/lipoyl-binding protein [Spiroplasma gladiatoris]|uniref:Biotin/lipoyl-binding protein n=1 Tax=Spiroplasma gladiatoris TaxID=2143 RepID=A0A4P7AII0_9MOLU|nr:biotin/lipoyl-binding protein [Spiroplasma gladiatoris]QBQ07991.1 biotin/lipoyl-binding protein [Spiroplasma gladiatoris]
MEKVKFKNSKKYKGIVEKVFVKDGQPVKSGDLVAQISTQLESVKVYAPIDGVIKNIYVIESLIVSHGDLVFDIMSNKELEGILKKPDEINDTLKDALSDFGFLEVTEDKEFSIDSEQTTHTVDYSDKLPNSISKTSLEIDNNKEKMVEVEGITQEIINNNYINKNIDEEVSKTQSLNQINKDFLDVELSNHEIDANEKKVNQDFNDNNISKTDELEKININFETILIEESSNKEDQSGGYVQVESITQEINNNLFLNNNDYEVSKTQALDEINKDFLNNKQEDLLFKEFKKPELKTIDIEHEFPKKASEFNDNINSKNPPHLLEDEKDKVIFEKHDPIIREYELQKNVENSEFLSRFTNEKELERIKVDLSNQNDKLDTIDAKTENIEIIEKELIKAQKDQKEALEVIENAVEELKHDLSNAKQQILNNVINKNNNVQNQVIYNNCLTKEVDITALLNLHTIMYDAFKAKNINLNLNSFYVKALALTLENFESDVKEENNISLIKNKENQLEYLKISLDKQKSINEIASCIEKSSIDKNIEAIALYDLSDFDIYSFNNTLDNNSILSISLGAVQNKLKNDMIVSNYVIINLNYNANALSLKDAVKFINEFSNLLSNPGLLI